MGRDVVRKMYDTELYSLLEKKLKILTEDRCRRDDYMFHVVFNQHLYSTTTILLAYNYFSEVVDEDFELSNIKKSLRDVRNKLSKFRINKDSDELRLRAKSFPVREILASHGIQIKADKCKCPFHDERTASFSIKKSNNTWHCFGCGKGGDSISLIMALDGISFRDAIMQLA